MNLIAKKKASLLSASIRALRSYLEKHLHSPRISDSFLIDEFRKEIAVDANFAETIITSEQARDLVVAALTSFFNGLLPAGEERRVLTSEDFDAARVAVENAMKKQYGPHHAFLYAVDSALMNSFSNILSKAGESSGVIVSRGQMTPVITQAAGEVKDRVEAAIQSMQPGFAEAHEAIGRLKRAGKWSRSYEIAGLHRVFREAAKSASTIAVQTSSGSRMMSTLQALEALIAELPSGEASAPSIKSSLIFADAADELARKRGISFGAALRELRAVGFTVEDDGTTSNIPNANLSHGIKLDQDSVELAETARSRSSELGIPYGDALRDVRQRRGRP
jgi:hypothetical protein